MGVYYSGEENKEYEIRGVMFWKGEEIAKAWKEQGSFEYHIFTKLNPATADDQKLIKDYWLGRDTAEGLFLHSS